jgi:hypothetical protein
MCAQANVFDVQWAGQFFYSRGPLPETLALKSYSLRYPVTPWICRDRESAADAASPLTETTKISNLIDGF